jgi:RNA polymerase sigma factor (sigma-70 family)
LIRERVPLVAYEAGPGPKLDDWTDEELMRIRLVLRRLTALRVDNPEDAEDLVQDTLLTMTEKCTEIRLEKGLLIWSMGILRKKIGNYYRRTRRSVSLDDLLAGAQDQDHNAVVEPTQETLLRHAELRALVVRALSGLAPRERIAVELFLSGSPTHEIADLLYPERYQNIVNWLHRGRKKLARELARHGYR